MTHRHFHCKLLNYQRVLVLVNMTRYYLSTCFFYHSRILDVLMFVYWFLFVITVDIVTLWLFDITNIILFSVLNSLSLLLTKCYLLSTVLKYCCDSLLLMLPHTIVVIIVYTMTFLYHHYKGWRVGTLDSLSIDILIQKRPGRAQIYLDSQKIKGLELSSWSLRFTTLTLAR